MADPVGEGTQTTTPPVGESGNVPMSQYIGVKEMLRKEETAHAQTKSELGTTQESSRAFEAHVTELGKQVRSLEEQMKSAIDPAEHEKIKTELTGIHTKALEVRKEALVNLGMDATSIKDLTSEQLAYIEMGAKSAKGQGGATQVTTPAQKPDLGGGGGTAPPTGAFEKIRAGFDALHPNG